MAIVLVGSLGAVGVVRGILLPGTVPDVAPLNPVGGILGALMLLGTPAVAGIWLARERSRTAAAAGLLGGGAIWLLTGPLFAMPDVAATLLDILAAGRPPTAAGQAATPALETLVRWAALGLPVAMLLGAGLAWSGAEFSPYNHTARTVSDVRSPTIAAGAGVGAALLLSLYILVGAPGLSVALLPPYECLVVALTTSAAPPSASLLLAPSLFLAVLTAVGLRSARRTPARDTPPTSPIAAGAWSFVALVWAIGLPLALFQTFAAGVWPLLTAAGPSREAAIALDPTTWNAMYDHTLVGLVIGMLAGLTVTTVAAFFAPPGGPGTAGRRAPGTGR